MLKREFFCSSVYVQIFIKSFSFLSVKELNDFFNLSPADRAPFLITFGYLLSTSITGYHMSCLTVHYDTIYFGYTAERTDILIVCKSVIQFSFLLCSCRSPICQLGPTVRAIGWIPVLGSFTFKTNVTFLA